MFDLISFAAEQITNVVEPVFSRNLIFEMADTSTSEVLNTGLYVLAQFPALGWSWNFLHDDKLIECAVID